MSSIQISSREAKQLSAGSSNERAYIGRAYNGAGPLFASSNLENAMSIRLLAAARHLPWSFPDASRRTAQKALAHRPGADGHPPQTHEYVAGLKILKKCLEPVEALEIVSVAADEPWKEGRNCSSGPMAWYSSSVRARMGQNDPKRSRR